MSNNMPDAIVPPIMVVAIVALLRPNFGAKKQDLVFLPRPLVVVPGFVQ